MFRFKKRRFCQGRERIKFLIREGISIYGFINTALPDHEKYAQYIDHIESFANGDYDAMGIVPDVRGMIRYLAGKTGENASEAYELFKKAKDRELAKIMEEMKPEILKSMRLCEA